MNEDKPYYELNPAEFIPWLVNFIAIVTANKANLPITDAQIAVLNTWLTQMQAALNAKVAAQQALDAADTELGEKHGGSKTEISYFNTIFKADKSIPRGLIQEMGLKVSGGKTSEPPKEPLDLTVKVNANGNNDLKCKRNGNKQNTIFVWEYQIGGETDWHYLISTSETKTTHREQTPGQQVAYRCKATRAGQESAYSNVAVAYFKG